MIHDPRAGEIRGHKQLRQFVSQNQNLAERHARIERGDRSRFGVALRLVLFCGWLLIGSAPVIGAMRGRGWGS